MGTNITFKRPDGKEAKGYLANAARGNAPGVVVIQEWWGLSENIKGLVDRFAVAGFDALAPDLYEGVAVPYHDADAAGKEMNSLNFIEATEQNVRGAVQYLHAAAGRPPGQVRVCGPGASVALGAAPTGHLRLRPDPHPLVSLGGLHKKTGPRPVFLWLMCDASGIAWGARQPPAASTCWKKPRAAAVQNGGTSPPW